MKLSIATLFAALGMTAIAASAAPAPTPAPKLSKWEQQQQEKFRDSAPADEYFGRMKMSFLGMNNTFRDAAISAGDHTTDPGIINKVALAEDALEAWGRKYPHDPQLARTYFLATQIDRKIWVKGNQDRAWIFFNRLVTLFPDSYFGKTLKKDLAIGFTEHYYAMPVPCSAPVPKVTSTVDPSAIVRNPSAPTLEPTASPTPSPSPSPIETTLGKGLRSVVYPQACVPPATASPSPSPSPMASATALPASSASTVPAPLASPAITATPTPVPR